MSRTSDDSLIVACGLGGCSSVLSIALIGLALSLSMKWLVAYYFAAAALIDWQAIRHLITAAY